MAVKTEKAPGLMDRIRDRHHRANEYLDGASPPKRLWANMHLYTADAVDTCVSAVNNKYSASLGGAVNGIGRGLLYGAIIGAVVATFFPLILFSPAVFAGAQIGVSAAAWISTWAVTTATIGLGYGVVDARNGYIDGLREDRQTSGGKVAEKICKHGHAIANEAVPSAFNKASQRVIKNTPVGNPPPTPNNGEGENHRFTDAVRKSRELESQGLIR